MRRFSRLAVALAAAGLVAGCAGSPPRAAEGGVGEVWIWEGPRRIDSFVEVPAGVTLRIRPGSVVRFAFVDADGDGVGDAGLHVLGRVEAVGEPGAPILFTSAEDRPQPGDWRGFVFDNSRGNLFSECALEYAEHALHAHFSSAAFTHCRIERNVEGTRLGNSRFEISRCLVRGNVSKGLNFFSCANRIHHNLITGNAVGIFLFETDTDSVITENNVLGNQTYDVRLGDFSKGGKALGPTWWGTTSPEEIRARIYDGAQDPGLGRVRFEVAPGPFETGWDRE